jgi:hypothetical protein
MNALIVDDLLDTWRIDFVATKAGVSDTLLNAFKVVLTTPGGGVDFPWALGFAGGGGVLIGYGSFGLHGEESNEKNNRCQVVNSGHAGIPGCSENLRHGRGRNGNF